MLVRVLVCVQHHVHMHTRMQTDTCCVGYPRMSCDVCVCDVCVCDVCVCDVCVCDVCVCDVCVSEHVCCFEYVFARAFPQEMCAHDMDAQLWAAELAERSHVQLGYRVRTPKTKSRSQERN